MVQKKLTLKFWLLFVVLFAASSAFAVDFQGEAGLFLNHELKIKPTFELTSDFGNLRLKANKGFIDFHDSFAFKGFKSLPSNAVSAELLTSGYEFSFRLLTFDFRYEKLLSNLRDSRRFVAHRVKVTRENLPVYLDFYETSVIVGEGKEIYYMYNHIPFLPVYLVQHLSLKNSAVDNKDINVLMGFNAGYMFKNKAILYVDVIVDDFPAVPWAYKQLPVMGTTLGYSSKLYGLEDSCWQFALAATANTRYLHAHWAGEGRYTVNNEFLGDDLGPDAAKINGVLNYQKPGLNAAFTLGYELHGPGTLGEYWVYIGREEAYKTFFLSEIVEQKAKINAYFTKNLTDEVELKTEIGLKRTYPKEDKPFNSFKGAIGINILF
ncbi:MAG: hypothetical protein PHD88_01025 [Firmicutes bacterium]|nr:hypothetical protein [Bacillota bacterium]MDD4692977.1 hypothetical protein [Bacillota bacterium]